MEKRSRFTKFLVEEMVPYLEARNKKPLLTQITEMMRLYWQYRSLPYQYIKSRLYTMDIERDVHNYIPPKLIANLQNILNDKSNLGFAYDKHFFRVFLEDKGLPVVREILRILPSGTIHGVKGAVISRAVAERILASHCDDVFVKPTKGSSGIGAFVHRQSAPLDDLFRDSVDTLVQPLVPQHETLKALHPCSLNTVRIDTLLYEGRCYNNAAVLKIGTGDMVVDNSRAGSLVVGINLETGRLYPIARQRAIFSHDRYERHPESGISFGSITVPFWKDVVYLTSKAAGVVPELRTLGWDVAITPTGPVLMEANINWNVNLMQDGWGGLGPTRIGRLALELRESQ